MLFAEANGRLDNTTAMKECESFIQDGEAAYVSIPRGGPIYVPDLVSPLTRVPDFEASLLQEIQVLYTILFSPFIASVIANAKLFLLP